MSINKSLISDCVLKATQQYYVSSVYVFSSFSKNRKRIVSALQTFCKMALSVQDFPPDILHFAVQFNQLFNYLGTNIQMVRILPYFSQETFLVALLPQVHIKNTTRNAPLIRSKVRCSFSKTFDLYTCSTVHSESFMIINLLLVNIILYSKGAGLF